MSACPRCRHQMDADAAFCPHCGHSMALEERRLREREAIARRRRWAWIGAGTLLLAAAAVLIPDQAPDHQLSGEVDLPAARRALEAADWPKAIRLLAPAGEVPAGVEARSLLALALHERCLADRGAGFERAARVRELSLADNPHQLAGLRARAELESSFGDARRAASWWEAALQEAGRRGQDAVAYQDLLLDAAVARALLGEFGRAELLLEELLQAQPAHSRALTNRGLLHLQAGRLRLAETDLLAALGSEPLLDPARAGLVETLRRQGRGAELSARSDLQGASSVTAHHARALLAEEAGDWESAARELRAARELAPEDRRLAEEQERIESRGD